MDIVETFSSPTLRAAINPSRLRSLSVAAGVATGAATAGFLAAIGASTLGNFSRLDTLGSVLLSSILLYSAYRLARRPTIHQTQKLGSMQPLNLPLFGLGLTTALSNPLSIPFFVSFYLAEPDFRTTAGSTAVCCIIFLMALSWFTAVGWLFSLPAIARSSPIWRKGVRHALAITMGVYAVKLLSQTLL